MILKVCFQVRQYKVIFKSDEGWNVLLDWINQCTRQADSMLSKRVNLIALNRQLQSIEEREIIKKRHHAGCHSREIGPQFPKPIVLSDFSCWL